MVNSNLATVGTFNIAYGSRKTIPTNTKNWLCDWINISAGTYLVGFTTQPAANVATYLKVTTGSPSIDRMDYTILLSGSGSAARVIKVETDSIMSAVVENESGASYETFVDPGAYCAWALRIK